MEIEINEEINKNIIKVFGVGGGGGNAANFMYEKGIYDVDFVVCNTDAKALALSPIPTKITIGEKGLGAGNKPEVGRQAAIDSLPEIEAELQAPIEMVFVTAGMGGGTGTGAAPVIAKAAKSKGILTVGIVTIPFKFEGMNRVRQALDGVAEMRKNVDAIIIITNERIKQLYGNLKISQAFHQADMVLATAAKGIAELITKTGYLNVDMNDVKTVLQNSGDAIMGSALASGEGRALRAIEEALNSPLLCNSDIKDASNVLLSISYGADNDEAEMDEVGEITDYLQDKLQGDAQMIWGCNVNEELGDNIQVTIVVTGLHLSDDDLFIAKPVEKPAPKPAQTTSFLDKLRGITSAPAKTEEAKPAAQSESAPEKLSDEAANRMAEQLYGNKLFGNKQDEKPAVATPEPPAPAPTPVPEPQPQPQPEPTPAPTVQPPVQEQPAPKPPITLNIDDLDSAEFLNNMERPNAPKTQGNDDTQMLNIN